MPITNKFKEESDSTVEPEEVTTVEPKPEETPKGDALIGQAGGGAFIATGGGACTKVEGTKD